MSRIGNLRGAPLFLRPSVVRGLVEGVDAIRKGLVQVPIAPIKLVDVPRRSEDPRLAKANDDSKASGWVATPVASEPEDWPDAPLPDHADPDLDRLAPAEDGQPTIEDAGCSHAVEREEPSDRHEEGGAATRRSDSRRGAGTSQGPGSAPRGVHGPSGSVDEAGTDRPAARVQHAGLLGGARAAAKGSIGRSEDQALRHRMVRRVHEEPGAVRKDGPDRLLASAEKALQADKRDLGSAADLIPNSTIGNGIALKRAPKIDVERLVKAHRAKDARPAKAPPAPLFAAPSREECPRCGVPGWKGCAHFLPCSDGPPPAPVETVDLRKVRKDRGVLA